MKKMLKWTLRLGVLLIVLVIGAAFAAVSYAGSLVKTGVEKGGTFALGVPTTLGGARVGLLSGELGLSGLQVGSPEGYSQPHFMTLGSGEVEVSLLSLNKPVITVPRFALDTIDVRLEKKGGKANYAAILENIKKVTGGGGGSRPAPSTSEKRLIIEDLSITNVTVHAQLLEGVAPASVTVPIKEVRLKNVGTGVAGTGVTVEELSAIIVEVLLAAAAENGGGILPAELLGDLKGSLGSLENLKQFGVESVAGLGENLKQELGKKLDEGAKKVIDDATKGLEGLLNGGKKK